MRRLSASVAAILATFAAGAQDIPFVPGQGASEQLTEQQRDVAQLAIDALAAELQIAKEGILVDTIRAVNWPDSSLGCPQPGRAYLEVVTPGHKVTLRADGRVHVVHEAKGRAFVCEKTRPYAGIGPKGELVFSRQMLDARKDLSSRLGVPESEIKPIGRPGADLGRRRTRLSRAGQDLSAGQGHRLGADARARETRIHVPHRPASHHSLPSDRRAVSRWQEKGRPVEPDGLLLRSCLATSGHAHSLGTDAHRSS